MPSGSRLVLCVTLALEKVSMTMQERRLHRMSAICVSFKCFLRGLPLLVASAPRTPLRVLCMMAFDTIYMLRGSKPLSENRLSVLAAFLDFAACANAALDGKSYCEKEYHGIQEVLLDAGLGPLVARYVTQLRRLERQRPSVGGGLRRFEEVRMYREAVARLSLETISEIVLCSDCSDQSALLYHCDDEMEILFRIVMQCQIIDDVVDYAQDALVKLPGFLTATASLSQAISETAKAARIYGSSGDLPESDAIFPLRMALFGVSVLSKLVIRIRYWHHQIVGHRNLQKCERESAACGSDPFIP